MSKKQKSGGKDGGGSGRVKVSIPADLARAVEATGGDLDATVERLLRDALAGGSADRTKGKLSGFLHDIAGPYLPQLEAVAKDVASKVAKDVATAAAAAALTTFATKAAGKDEEERATAPAKPAPAAPRKPAPAPKSRAAARPRPPVKSAPKPTGE